MTAVRGVWLGVLGLAVAALLLPAIGTSVHLTLALLLAGAMLMLACSVFALHAAEKRLARMPADQVQPAVQPEVIQHLLDAIPHPIYVKDAASRYILLNDAFCRERGQSRESLIGKSSFDLAPDPAVAELSAREDAQVLAGEPVWKEESNIHPVTGRPRFRMVSKIAGSDGSGSKVVVGASIDVTTWRQAERILHLTLESQARTRAQLQSIFDAMPNPVFVKDDSHRYLFINTACEHLIGHSSALVLGHAAHEFLDPAMAEALEANERVLLLKPTGTVMESELCIRQGGELKTYQAHKVVSMDSEGRRIIVGSLGDVSSLQEAEARWLVAKEQAERANQAKSLFLANMSHELRTPLHGILSFARLGEAKVRSASHEKLQHYFEHIAHSGDRLLSLLNDLLDLSKLEAGHADVDIRPVDMEPVIAEAIEEFEALMDGRGQRVLLQKACSVHAAADDKRIGQVLRNLLSNAIKFSPDGGTISLSICETRLSPSPYYSEGMLGVEIIVADEGIGIPPTELESVFDKFVQSSATRDGSGGTGLGLAICREIVRAHRGELFARNRSHGGAEFVLRLPAARPAALRVAA